MLINLIIVNVSLQTVLHSSINSIIKKVLEYYKHGHMFEEFNASNIFISFIEDRRQATDMIFNMLNILLPYFKRTNKN